MEGVGGGSYMNPERKKKGKRKEKEILSRLRYEAGESEVSSHPASRSTDEQGSHTLQKKSNKN